MTRPLPEKACSRCGRRMTWRRKWAKNWASVKFCSQDCRRQGVTELDGELERRIVDLLSRRSGSICPSEAARAAVPDTWRVHMEDARNAGRRLAADDRVVFTQQGRTVDPSHAKGPVRLARGPAF
ncbi:MAG: hypothetical protein CMN28_05905 [Salinisphaeraceae bacterium]|nr:hypothetical protein [Salinisphaeraceae bacterium]